ncbi:Retrovirus-related Pol polyprotein, partial [Mucuna pruriens]
MDYRDLNRASPKDNFPLLHIDVLVDNTAQYAFCSFMDGFSGYNQIMMLIEDREKMMFITLWGTFCYKVMSFVLKNAGVTYQRAMVTLFHDMMYKEIEVYVDDMIAKSKTPEPHIEDLQKLFVRLHKYKLRLNPAKCTFVVKTGKLLGFVVNENGIEVDPDKVRAIKEMLVPKTESKVRRFLGQVNFIARFISQLMATCSPIFKLLWKTQKMEWDIECQEAFDNIKRYFENPPVLVPVAPGQPLILYLTVLEESMGCMLGQQDATGKKEQAIYYLSKKFTDCERWYSALERTCCALVWAAKRLRPYMIAHTTWLVAKNDPVKYIFEKPALTGRIARWQMALSEYDILYVSRKAIKGSALAEQLAYHPPGRLVTTRPRILRQAHHAKLGFDCTNNMAEYEACTMGLLMTLEYQVKRFKVFGDSALVIYQLRGEWEMRDAKLIPYHDHVREIVTAFDMVTFHHIPREENQMEDALTTLSVMVHE